MMGQPCVTCQSLKSLRDKTGFLPWTRVTNPHCGLVSLVQGTHPFLSRRLTGLTQVPQGCPDHFHDRIRSDIDGQGSDPEYGPTLVDWTQYDGTMAVGVLRAPDWHSVPDRSGRTVEVHLVGTFPFTYKWWNGQ